MEPVDEVGVAVANVYAKALFDLAEESGDRESLLEELESLVAYVNATPEFEAFLVGGRADASARRAVLEKALRGRCSDLLLDAVHVLNRKGRLSLLEQIGRQYRLADEAARHQVEVTVRTAVPLSESARQSLVEALKEYTGREPILAEQVDASLIGGLVVRVGDEKLDFSVSRRLRGLREALVSRASQEIHSNREYVEKV